MRSFYLAYTKDVAILPQAVAEIPWPGRGGLRPLCTSPQKVTPSFRRKRGGGGHFSEETGVPLQAHLPRHGRGLLPHTAPEARCRVGSHPLRNRQRRCLRSALSFPPPCLPGHGGRRQSA